MAFNHSIIQSFNHSIIQSFNHSIILSFYHSIILSFYHSIKQSSNQAIKQSSNQAIKQRYHTFITIYPFYKRSLKNPLLFIIPSFIPSFINPFIDPRYNIFKPFDSISPIFKPVGLTELNSIQGEDDDSVRRFKSA
ncbi:hypothetical protein F7191_05300 [Helicobacter pylori]|uniref:hypothetical protein n=1 Tax=Helicobacter pylori TaxID=210 RepID=UPI0012E753FC|nr:hypothetical protein [Helicobacter pylori]MUU21943.1 hypothetical protein [Helicobacter pylori]